MSAFRRLLVHRHLAVLIFAAALLMKLAVPGGYMVSDEAGWPTITLCPQVTSTQIQSVEATMDDLVHMDMIHADAADKRSPSHSDGKAELPCVFSALAAATIAATDPLLLVALIAFVMALGISGIVLPGRTEPARSRPPLRGPPTLL
ncbi:hypothetical protein [Sphingomonas sp. Mn802worker]|uniref:hypothetical protein n=1 Tax=Sphingomonas sp. Mn802worker TaxID=629773 RepID=UPI00037E1DF5|nr:hypothetical protein [Sphingomonas sp. Mn802worker]